MSGRTDVVNGLYVTLMRYADDGFHIILIPETLEIGLDVVLSSLAGNTQIIG